jgi:hexosaminidase
MTTFVRRSGVVACLLALFIGQASALWPWPQLAELGTGTVQLASSFEFVTAAQSTRLSRGIERYQKLVHSPAHAAIESSATTTVSQCDVTVASVAVDADAEFKTLAPGVDESYTIKVTDSGSCSISANTVWGALYGMETFTQLLVRNTDLTVAVNNVPVNIEDSSRFTHRGMLVDTSRHYLPMSELKRIIDTYPMSKLNVLHWHAVDAQSFPLKLPSAPQMVKGAYAPQLIYTTADVEEISSYAADRGVRVLLEIDVPGHASSWQWGEPDLMADCIQKYTNVNSK